MKRSATIFLLLLLPPLLLSCSDPAPIKIGFVAGLSGRVADLGIAGRNGVILATEEINREGGIHKRRVELLIRDDKQNPEQARSVVKELLQARVSAIIGPMTSAMSMATLPLMNQAETVLLSPTTTTTQLSGRDDYFFRITSTTDFYTDSIARYFIDHGIKRVTALYDKRNLAYTGSWLDSLAQNFEISDDRIINRIGFTSGADIHFSKLARQVLDSAPDAIISVGNALDTAMFAQQLRKTGSKLPLATSEWAATEKLIDLGGPAVEGIILDQFFDRESQLPSYLAFRQAFKTRFAEEPGFASVAAYDAAHTLYAALKQNSDPATLKQTLLQTGTFPGVQGDVHFDAYGDSDRPTFLIRIENGQFKRIK